MKLLPFLLLTFRAMKDWQNPPLARLDFETNIALEIIPSTIELHDDGAHTVQLRINGPLTAKVFQSSHPNKNLDSLKKLIASGKVEFTLVNKAAPVDWHKVAIEQEKYKDGHTGDEWMKGTRGPSDREMRQDGDTAMTDI